MNKAINKLGTGLEVMATERAIVEKTSPGKNSQSLRPICRRTSPRWKKNAKNKRAKGEHIGQPPDHRRYV